MLGYWIAFPVVCVVLERTRRFYLTFFGHHPARLEALDDGTVVITAERPEGQKWYARAGQFVSLFRSSCAPQAQSHRAQSTAWTLSVPIWCLLQCICLIAVQGVRSFIILNHPIADSVASTRSISISMASIHHQYMHRRATPGAHQSRW